VWAAAHAVTPWQGLGRASGAWSQSGGRAECHGPSIPLDFSYTRLETGGSLQQPHHTEGATVQDDIAFSSFSEDAVPWSVRRAGSPG